MELSIKIQLQDDVTQRELYFVLKRAGECAAEHAMKNGIPLVDDDVRVGTDYLQNVVITLSRAE